MSIFVAIPAYRDPECKFTIQDLYSKAKFPANVRVGVVWQADETDGECYTQQSLAEDVSIVRMPYQEAKGPCYARAFAWDMVDPHRDDYLLSIDCHMRFVPNWDEELINALAACPSAKPVLTGYPTGYEPAPGSVAERRSSLLCATQFDTNGMLRTAGKLLASVHSAPLPSLFWAAGFRCVLSF